MRKNKNHEPEPLCLWFTYSESGHGGEAAEPDYEWSSHAPHFTEVTFEGCYREGPSGLCFQSTSVEVSEEIFNAEKVYLVVVRYQDGDTFGTSHGNWVFIDVFLTEEEAGKVVEGIEKDTYTSPRGYNCWEGYFNELEGVEVHEFPVRGKAPNIGSDTYQSIKAKLIRH